jgi:NAD(P)-dependent dehydrogenase (short-subunit alcohol dehydrogenase family)
MPGGDAMRLAGKGAIVIGASRGMGKQMALRLAAEGALPLMPDGGCIVINGSITSVEGMAAFGVYAASKAALRQAALRSFARTWSVDLKD